MSPETPLTSRLSPDPGACRACRHANQGTLDIETGHVACRFKGGVPPEAVCDLKVQRKDGGVLGWCFARFDGKNGTWGRPEPVRFLAPGEADPAG